MNPLQYAQKAILINEFSGGEPVCCIILTAASIICQASWSAMFQSNVTIHLYVCLRTSSICAVTSGIYTVQPS